MAGTTTSGTIPPPPSPFAAGSTGGTAGSQPTAVKPTKPMNGDLFINAEGKWDVWTGGKPKYDWSGLDTNAAMIFELPNQL